jgi:hypothetical protein
MVELYAKLSSNPSVAVYPYPETQATFEHVKDALETLYNLLDTKLEELKHLDKIQLVNETSEKLGEASHFLFFMKDQGYTSSKLMFENTSMCRFCFWFCVDSV